MRDGIQPDNGDTKAREVADFVQSQLGFSEDVARSRAAVAAGNFRDFSADGLRSMSYHGEPAPEITATIWRVAEERYPEDSARQSAFNDGAHFLVQVMRRSCAEIVRLHAMLDTTGAFTDKAAFGKFNADYSKAYRAANEALTAVLGEPVVEALHFQAIEADATLPYEAEEA